MVVHEPTMAPRRHLEPLASRSTPASAPKSPRDADVRPEADLRSTLEALIAGGDRCRARITAVNPETGQYRVVLQERWPRAATGRDSGEPARDGPAPPERRGQRFTVRDLLTLERSTLTRVSLRSKLGALLESSRSVTARLENVDPDKGDLRIVLQGTLGGFAAGPTTDRSPESDLQDVTRKLKSLINEATRSS
jgi:hypothetical protein